jgi:hypothetical protein
MKKLALLAVACVALGGCSWFQGSLRDDIAVSLKTSTDKILPQYLAYVEADTTIPDSVKKTRKGNAEELAATIEDIQPKE